MIDRSEYTLLAGWLGALVDRVLVARHMRSFLVRRNAVLKQVAEKPVHQLEPGSSVEETILQVVRGEAPVVALKACGIIVHVKSDPNGYYRATHCENPQQVKIAPQLTDLACGLLAYRHDSAALQRWSTAIYVAGTDFLDYERLESEEDFDPIVDALWDAAYGQGITEASIRVAEKLLSQPDEHS